MSAERLFHAAGRRWAQAHHAERLSLRAWTPGQLQSEASWRYYWLAQKRWTQRERLLVAGLRREASNA